jgi:TolB protein
MKFAHLTIAALLASTAASAAYAQDVPAPQPQQPAQDQDTPLSVDVTNTAAKDLVIAIPAMPTSQAVSTPAGPTDQLGAKLAEVVDDDLRNTGLFKTTGPSANVRSSPMAKSRRPITAAGTAIGAGAGPGLCPRQWQRLADRRLLSLRRALQSELVRQGFVVSPATGAAPRTNAPTRSMPGSPAKAPISTARSSTSPRPAPRTSAASSWRSWTRTAPITAS